MIKTKNKTGLLFFPAFDWSISPNHPEREERLLYTRDQIFEEGLMDLDGIIEYPPQMANFGDIIKTHICVAEPEDIITESHLISAGSCKAIADSVLTGQVDKGFALVRPPGHHAMLISHGARGFCNINIEAVMVEYIRDNYDVNKIAIIDTDAHHADGTQDIYFNDPDVLHISIHQDGRTIFPGTGFPNDLGGPGGFAYTLNVPVPTNTTDEGLLYIMDNLIKPVLEDFKPDLIINAAGQDNHFTDPLTMMNITAQGYAELTNRLDPDIVVLEGGYSIEGALPYVNLGIILALAGLDYTNVKEPDLDDYHITTSPRIMDQIIDYVKHLSEIYFARNEINLDEYFGTKELFTKKRNIFYDTSGFLEKQNAQFYKCDSCSGIRVVESSVFGSNSIAAIIVPRKACNECMNRADNLNDDFTAFFERYDYVYVQDHTKQKYSRYPEYKF